MTIVSIILAIICFFLVLKWDVTDDYKKWLKGVPVKHGEEAFVRAFLLIPSTVLFSIHSLINWRVGSIWTVLTVIGMQGFSYLLLFDGWYNYKRGFNWWFLGSVDPDDAWWDRVQRRIKLKWLKVFKIGVPISFVIVYVLLNL